MTCYEKRDECPQVVVCLAVYLAVKDYVNFRVDLGYMYIYVYFISAVRGIHGEVKCRKEDLQQ